ncbi:MAG: hypothetical protein ABW209_06575, partial [Pseudomonas caspiana]
WTSAEEVVNPLVATLRLLSASFWLHGLCRQMLRRLDTFHTKHMNSKAEHFQSAENVRLLALRQFTYYKQWVLCTPVIFSFSRDD